MDDVKKFLEAFPKALAYSALVSFVIYTNDSDGSEIWSIRDIDWDGVDKLANQPYVTLAEAALIISERLGCSNQTLEQMPKIFMSSIQQGELDPRDTSSLIPLSKISYLDIASIGWGWALTPSEVGEFAIRKSWPEYLFTDLLNDSESLATAPKQIKDKGKYKNPETEKWKIEARRIGKTWLKQQRQQNNDPGIIEIAKHVEAELKRLDIRGPRGDYLSWETIKREALKGITGKPANGKGQKRRKSAGDSPVKNRIPQQ